MQGVREPQNWDTGYIKFYYIIKSVLSLSFSLFELKVNFECVVFVLVKGLINLLIGQLHVCLKVHGESVFY